MDLSKQLSLVNLNIALKAMPEYGVGGKKATLFLRATGIFCFVAGVLSLGAAPHFFSKEMQRVLAYWTFVIEMAGICIALWSAWRESSRFKNPAHDYEKGLDHDFEYHRAIMDWLVSQPGDRLVQYARYVRFRKDSMTRRLPFLVGSTQLVAALPVAAVLYVQIRAVEDSGSMTTIEWLATLTFTILLGLSWSLIVKLMRLETCAAMLDDAVLERANVSTRPSDTQM